jgi:hypothetical protein
MQVQVQGLHIYDVFLSTEWLHILCISLICKCFREAVAHRRCVSTKWKPLWGCTSYAHHRCVPQRAAHLRCASASEAEGAAHHRCVPFHKVVAHRRCVSAKRLHIENVLPLWGCTSYAHQRCVPPKGCTS